MSDTPSASKLIAVINRLDDEQVKGLIYKLKQTTDCYAQELLRWVRFLHFGSGQAREQLLKKLEMADCQPQFLTDVRSLLVKQGYLSDSKKDKHMTRVTDQGHQVSSSSASAIEQTAVQPMRPLPSRKRQRATGAQDNTADGWNGQSSSRAKTRGQASSSGESHGQASSNSETHGLATTDSIVDRSPPLRDPIPPRRERLIEPLADIGQAPPVIERVVGDLMPMSNELISQAILLAAQNGVFDLDRACQITDNLKIAKRDTLRAYFMEVVHHPHYDLVVRFFAELRVSLPSAEELASSTTTARVTGDTTDSHGPERPIVRMQPRRHDRNASHHGQGIDVRIWPILEKYLKQDDRIFVGRWLELSRQEIHDALPRPLHQTLNRREDLIRAIDGLKSWLGRTEYLVEVARLLNIRLGYDERHYFGQGYSDSDGSSPRSALGNPYDSYSADNSPGPHYHYRPQLNDSPASSRPARSPDSSPLISRLPVRTNIGTAPSPQEPGPVIPRRRS